MTETRTWLSEEDVADTAVRAHFPTGHAWIALVTPGKILHSLIGAFAAAYEDAWRFLGALWRELDYRTTTQMLLEWEAALGLPDPCLPTATTLAERRAWIAFRLNKTRWNTLADWHALAALYGLTIRVTPGWVVQRPALFAGIFPKPFYDFPKLGRFRVYIDLLDEEFGGFPYDGTSITEDKFAIPFRSSSAFATQFRCMIERVAPANVLIIWNEFPAVPPNGNGVTFSDDFDEEFS